MLNGDNLGQPFRDLSAAAAYRKAELMATCANYGIIWPFMPGNQMLAGLPVTVHNPLVTSLDTKLHHQIARVQQYFSARGHRRGNALSLDRLGDRAYEDGNCDIFQQQAASLLQVLKDLDLLKVACAIAANNYVFIIDHVSTHIPRETLTAIVENLEYNAKLMNNSITPFTMVQHEYIHYNATGPADGGVSERNLRFSSTCHPTDDHRQRHVRAVSEHRSNFARDTSPTLHVRGLK